MDCLILESERMHVRQFRQEDFGGYFSLESNPEVMRYITGKPRTLQECTKRFNQYLQDYPKDPGFGVWAVCHPGRQQLIGTACLNYIEQSGIRQIGYKIAPEHQGKGLATELALALLQYAFEGCGLTKVSAFCDPGNKASEKVMQKAGMVYRRRNHFYGLECLHYQIELEKWFLKKEQSLSFTANHKEA